jgi:hypothetical protein
VTQRWKGLVPFLCTRVQALLCTSVIPVVSYMLTGLARCSVGPGISCGTHKLTRTSRIIKKKKSRYMHLRKAGLEKLQKSGACQFKPSSTADLCVLLFLMAIWFISLFFILLCSKSCAKLITSLPGQPGNVSLKRYTGYILTDAKHGRALLYYFVAAESADPLSHPLTL